MSHPHLNKTLHENDSTGDLTVLYQVTGTFTAPLWGAGVGEPEAVHDAVQIAGESKARALVEEARNAAKP